MTVCIYTVFDEASGRPLASTITMGTRTVTYDLYRRGTGLAIAEVERRLAILGDLMMHIATDGDTLLVNDFKAHLDAINWSIDGYNGRVVLDPAIHDVNDYGNAATLSTVDVDQLIATGGAPWQRLLACAGAAYHDIQRVGIMIDGELVHPGWSHRTFTLRSKNTGAAVQNAPVGTKVVPVGGATDIVYCSIDWNAADLMAATLLSGDAIATADMKTTDPYLTAAQRLKANGVEIDRAGCKEAILKSLNGHVGGIDLLKAVYPDIALWLLGERQRLESDGVTRTLFGRLVDPGSRSGLSALNATMQGTIAHLMHAAVYRLWQRLPNNFLFDVHDQVILALPAALLTAELLKWIIGVMRRPLDTSLATAIGASGLAIPLGVSIRHSRTFRDWE